MRYEDVVLPSSGKTVRVYVPPVIRIMELAERRFPPVQRKIVTSPTVSGGTLSMVIEDDPEYDAAVVEREQKVNEEIERMYTVFALKDEKPPEGWKMDADLVELVRLSDPDWMPGAPGLGTRMDYILWDLLYDPKDSNAVQEAVTGLLVTEEASIDVHEATFPGEVAGEGPEPVADEAG